MPSRRDEAPSVDAAEGLRGGDEGADARRIVVLAGECFPPIRHPGSQRVLSWAKHLPAHGWKVVVVTLPVHYRPVEDRDDSLLGKTAGMCVERVPPLLSSRIPRSLAGSLDHRDARQGHRVGFRSFLRSVLVPDPRILWILPALKTLRRVASLEGVDAVLTTSPEASSHIAGALARVLLRIPWVADLRDPWRSRGWRGRLRAAIETGMARWVLPRADRVTVVSEGLRSLAASEYGIPTGRITIIPHGFDAETLEPAETPSAERPPGARPFFVVHTGKMYPSQNPQVLLKALAGLADEESIRVRFVGDWSPDALREIDPHRDEPWLELVPSRPHAAALEEQRRADLLVLFAGRTPDWVPVPSKTYEYLATGRPVLALCEKGTDLARLLEIFPQARRVDPDDVAGLRRALRAEIESPRPSVPAAENRQRLAQYERGTVMAEMAQVLKDAVRS